MKTCVVKPKAKRSDNQKTMISGEIITKEINTEIKVEVELETASIVKVSTMKGQCNNPITGGVYTDLPSSSVDLTATQALEKEKTRSKILADCEVNKLTKQATETIASNNVEINRDKTREDIKTEREAKKLAKQAAKAAKAKGVAINSDSLATVNDKLNEVKISDTNKVFTDVSVGDKKQSTLTKSERRAIQEAQRAAKAQAQKTAAVKGKGECTKTIPPLKEKTGDANKISKAPNNSLSILPSSESTVKKVTTHPPVKTVRFNDGNVKLFAHLEKPNTDNNLFVNNIHIHPSIARLGEQYAKRTIVGSNARCMAFLNVIKMVIQDYETPPKKEFNRSLESFIANCVAYLQKCRTLAVSIINAHKSLKQVLMQLPKDEPESELKERLFTFIDTYIENQLKKAAQAINSMLQKKINNGDVILTFGCSSLINYICEEAQTRKVDFRVIVVDSRPFYEGQELLRRLTAKEIPCSYVLINAVGFVMPEVTKVLMGAHALLANGYVMARTGTAQVALVARSFNVPVLVCCETHKFSERFQTDAIVYNELGNPDDIVVDDKCCLSNWQAKSKMSPLNLNYDITPPELVTAVVTEVSVLPCTSVPVILRIKPDWPV